MADRATEAPDGRAQDEFVRRRPARRALRRAKRHLQRSALKLVAYLAVAYLILKLIPSLKQALSSLEHAHWQPVLAAFVLETISEFGFVVSWRALVDPDDVLSREGRGRRVAARVAWAQLGGGTLIPGGSWGGLGVGAWILHHFGMPFKLIAEREFNLSFLNTAVDALALVLFGLALAIGILPGERNLLLTLLPAGAAAIALLATVLVARRLSRNAERKPVRHARIGAVIATLSEAVENTQQLLFHRGNGKAVLGALVYLALDVQVLWVAFIAVHSHPVVDLGVVVMSYIIGALGGSIPLPAGIGTIGGMVGAFILYGVSQNEALAAVLLYQAIGLLVPLIGGALAYVVLRRDLGPIHATALDASE